MLYEQYRTKFSNHISAIISVLANFRSRQPHQIDLTIEELQNIQKLIPALIRCAIFLKNTQR